MSDELDPRAAGARRLRDKVCIVTGAGQGIGRAAAKRLGQEGGKIVVADRVEPAAEQTVGELRQHGVDAASAIVDLGAFDHVCQGNRAMMLVEGYAGIGKTALIQELDSGVFVVSHVG